MPETDSLCASRHREFQSISGSDKHRIRKAESQKSWTAVRIPRPETHTHFTTKKRTPKPSKTATAHAQRNSHKNKGPEKSKPTGVLDAPEIQAPETTQRKPGAHSTAPPTRAAQDNIPRREHGTDIERETGSRNIIGTSARQTERTPKPSQTASTPEKLGTKRVPRHQKITHKKKHQKSKPKDELHQLHAASAEKQGITEIRDANDRTQYTEEVDAEEFPKSQLQCRRHQRRKRNHTPWP